MNRAYTRTGPPGRSTRWWLPVLLWALISAILTLLVIWWLLPGTPSAVSVAQTAVSAATRSIPTANASAGGSTAGRRRGGVTPAHGFRGSSAPGSSALGGVAASSVAGKVAAAIPPGSHVIIGLPAVASSLVYGPVTVLPEGATGGAAGKAPAAYAGTAMAFGADGIWAVAATAPSSSAPVIFAAALLAALAALGGALAGRRRTRAYAPPLAPPAEPASTLAGTERIPSNELSRLRLGAQQRTVLARRLAELLPSLPEAVAWQAEKALAEVGVRTVVPDGEIFDPASHYAVGTEAVPARGAENTIVRTVRPGYSDDEHILVYPKVVVYAGEADGSRP